MLLDKALVGSYNFGVRYGLVAQLGAHHIRIVGVEGSNPFKSTNKNTAILAVLFIGMVFTKRRFEKSVAARTSAAAASWMAANNNLRFAQMQTNPFKPTNKKTSFVYKTKVVFLNDVCLRQMMLATLMMPLPLMMSASPNILGQTSHHCDQREQHHYGQHNIISRSDTSLKNV